MACCRARPWIHHLNDQYVNDLTVWPARYVGHGVGAVHGQTIKGFMQRLSCGGRGVLSPCLTLKIFLEASLGFSG